MENRHDDRLEDKNLEKEMDRRFKEMEVAESSYTPSTIQKLLSANRMKQGNGRNNELYLMLHPLGVEDFKEA